MEASAPVHVVLCADADFPVVGIHQHHLFLSVLHGELARKARLASG